ANTDFRLSERRRSGLSADRAGRFMQRNEAQLLDTLAFSPNGRMLAGEQSGVRLWGERGTRPNFFDGTAVHAVNGQLAGNVPLGWYYRTEPAPEKLYKRLDDFGLIRKDGKPNSSMGDDLADFDGPTHLVGGLLPLVERGPALPSLLYQPLTFNE